MRSGGRLAVVRALAAAALAVILIGCASRIPPTRPLSTASPSSASPTQSPPAPLASPSVTVGLAWREVPVAQPSVVTDAPSVTPGMLCSPCHPAAASQLFAVAPWPGGLLAVGVQQPPVLAVAFTSTPNGTWTAVAAFAPGDGTNALATVTLGHTTVVVGTKSGRAAAWVTDEAGKWSDATIDDPGGTSIVSGMTTVIATTAGFIAGGYRDEPVHGTTAAAIWRSTDGLHWTAVGQPGAFSGGRIRSLAAEATTIVAVGTAGDPAYGPAAAWVTADGAVWRRASISGDGRGVMASVAATPKGFVAVGQDGADDGAATWTSSDGSSWAPSPHQDAFGASGASIRMLSVAADGDALVAGGWQADAANGSSAAWSSVDGITWTHDPWVPAFSGGQIAGVALIDGSAIAVGRSGYPDNNQATVWEAAVRP